MGFPWRAAATPRGVAPLPEKGRTGADFETAWARRLPARLARVLIVEGPMRGAVRGVANPERTGLDRLSDLDTKKAVIFAANHHSHVDAPLLITSVPEPWRHRLVVGAGRGLLLRDTLHRRSVRAGDGSDPDRPVAA